jgi:hypothetical protein
VALLAHPKPDQIERPAELGELPVGGAAGLMAPATPSNRVRSLAPLRTKWARINPALLSRSPIGTSLSSVGSRVTSGQSSLRSVSSLKIGTGVRPPGNAMTAEPRASIADLVID